MRSRDLWITGMLALGIIACGGGGGTDSAATGVEVVVSPETASLGPGGGLTFTATVTGTADTAVEWSVQEGPAGGQVTQDGAYTAPALAGTYHVVAASRADPTKSAAASVIVNGNAPPANGAPMTTASRTSGVAPLAVFFDAVDDTASATTYAWRTGVVQPADKEGAHYTWDFGDPGSGAWSTTGHSRNDATGYTAAHVFEDPGTYTVTLTVTDTAGTTNSYVQTITVTPFTGPTGYASADGVAPAPGTPEAPTSFSNGITWVNAGSGRRLLLRRGDTFRISGTYSLSAAGPSILGAFDPPGRPGLPRPVLKSTSYATSDGGGTTFLTTRGSDWRVMDIAIEGALTTAFGGGDIRNYNLIGPVTYRVVNLLIYRVGLKYAHVGFWSNEIGPPINEGLFVVDSTSEKQYEVGGYLWARWLAVLGCEIKETQFSHVLRVYGAHKGVIANNRLLDPSVDSSTNGGTYRRRHALKLMSPPVSYGRPATRWVTVTDNIVRGQGPTVSIGPEDSISDERVSHVVYERNHHLPGGVFGPDPYSDLVLMDVKDVIARNNVLNQTGRDDSWTGIEVYRRYSTSDPALLSIHTPENVRILHNTVVSDGPGEFVGISIDDAAANVTVRGNLLAGTGSATIAVAPIYVGPGYDSGDDLLMTPAQALFADPGSGNFSLQQASPAVDAAVPLPEVRTDYLGFERPPEVGADVGAFESH